MRGFLSPSQSRSAELTSKPHGNAPRDKFGSFDPSASSWSATLRPFGKLVVFVMPVMDPALGGAHNVLMS
jgi:hypothetical protein